MASEPKKPRVEESDENSTILTEKGVLGDAPEEIVDNELFKLPIGDKIDFTVKSHLTDATFIIEGKKIYAGSDFLSLLSPYFNTLLKEKSFIESSKEEIELKDVKYDDFFKMLEYLADPLRKIESDDVRSLLTLADFYDIKCLVDRVEDFLLKSNQYVGPNKEFTKPVKLLLADQFRLVGVEAKCGFFSESPGEWLRLRKEEIVNSDEFPLLSDSAKAAFHADQEYRSKCDNYLVAVEKVDEPTNGFIALKTNAMECFQKFGHLTQSESLAGLLWTFDDYGVRDDDSAHFSPYLIVNQNRQSSSAWSVEGFVEVTMVMVWWKTGKEERRKTNTFAFSLNNTNRVGRMNNIPYTDRYEDSNWVRQISIVSIYVTKTSGLRQSPSFDFTVPSELTDAAFIVQGKKIHVNKQYLSTISPRFLKMFTDKNEVEVKDMEYEAFIEFLYWIYPSARRNLIASSMFSVLQVSKQLKVEIDKSVILRHINLSDQLTPSYFIEKTIFFFEFKCGYEREVRTYFGGWIKGSYDLKYNMIKNSPLYARMSPKKKAVLDDYISKRWRVAPLFDDEDTTSSDHFDEDDEDEVDAVEDEEENE